MLGLDNTVLAGKSLFNLTVYNVGNAPSLKELSDNITIRTIINLDYNYSYSLSPDNAEELINVDPS